MVVCELDNEVSGEVLGWKLPAWQALLLHRVLPSCGGLVIYMTVICFDLAVIYGHYQSGADGLTAFCIILMVLPAIICMIFTFASPPPGLRTELTAYTVEVEKSDIKWIFMQIVNTIFFPIAAIGRYCYLIFWWIEAVFASRAGDEDRIEEALANARAPSPLELYLFLQSFIHSAPNTIVNIVDMMAGYSNPDYDKMVLQAVSLVASSLRMASTATMYRRFEREKICGRRYPWSNNVAEDTDNENNENVENNKENSNVDPIYEPVLKRQSISSQMSSYSRQYLNSDLIQFSPRSSEKYPYNFDHLDSDTDSSSDYLPPVTRRHSDLVDGDDENGKPLTIIDRVAPRRRDTQYTIQEVDIPPPPLTPAPRPGSLAVWAEKMVENAESLPTWLSAPPRRKHWEVIPDEPDIPRRVPRSQIRGLEPQDITAALVQFLGWYAFFVARLLSIAAFIDFFPYLAIIILFSHYQIMLLFLIVPQASTVKRAFYLFLAFIYLFCLMEFKIRFRHVRVWHVFWIIVCTVEIILFVGLWTSIDNNLHNWWKKYIVLLTFGSLLFSYMLLLVYFVLLQPSEKVVKLKKKYIKTSDIKNTIV
ncbi:uncharacterized protein [Epargyreus clarus]|uniref:uncharacterized protein n=1 Tax=Epargyreus clarus TaxID=520877 RepID=UPI003C30A513